MLFDDFAPANSEFFRHHQPFFDHQHFLYDRHDGGIAFFPDGWNLIHFPIDWHSLDIDFCPAQMLTNHVLALINDRFYLDASVLYNTFTGDEPLFHKRNSDIIMLFKHDHGPLLFGITNQRNKLTCVPLIFTRPGGNPSSTREVRQSAAIRDGLEARTTPSVPYMLIIVPDHPESGTGQRVARSQHRII